MRLSKSRFLSGLQCHLRLWYECFERQLATPPDPATRALFDTGHEVGRLAQQRYPGGMLVKWNHLHPREAVAETGRLVGDPGVPAIYEGAFEHGGVLIRADILKREGDGFALVEVKASTRVKEVNVPDVAVQLWALRGAGIDVRRAGVLLINKRYVYDGEFLDVNELFEFHDLTETVEPMLEEVDGQVTAFHGLLAGAPPRIEPGPHCFTPYECPFYAHCTRHRVAPEYPLGELPRLNPKRLAELEAAGISDVREVPENFPLSPMQAMVRQSVLSGEDRVHGDLGTALESVAYPVHHLDFETVGPAIPRYAGTSPYDMVAFQFSVHTQSEDGTLTHSEYLHTETSDPRPPLARALLDALGDAGSICVYSSYERKVIGHLAAALPELAPRLEALLDRIWDLHPVIRNNYYHPQFRGSFSIKKVLPAVVPEMGYEDLEISEGGMASIRYEQALRCDDWVERENIFRALREYCAQDTLAMVALRRALSERAGEARERHT
ncbi:MAG TPA: DUF2779 domain-containing protein [Gammaproteobacteria bacterium]|nr:DUF2779 domain-containing protein [Gammaproteobacteria bacterium]